MKQASILHSILILMLSAALGMAPALHAADDGETPSAEQVRQDARELMDSLKAYSAEQRDEAAERASEALERIDARIDALRARMEARWQDMDAQTRRQAQESLEALRRQRDRVAERYEALKEDSGETWERVKRGFTDAYRALHEAWEDSEGTLEPDE